MSNSPDKTQHRASYAIVDVLDVSPVEDQVRVQVELSPSRWGYASSVITLVVPKAHSDGEIRKWVCRKIKQETQLDYLPDELHSPVLEAPSAADSVEEPRLLGGLQESALEMPTQTLGERYPQPSPKRSPSQEQEQEQDAQASVSPVQQAGKRSKRKGKK